jgi:hypothetical protein
MPRQLIMIPPDVRLAGARPVAPGYPKPYTAQQMRGWSNDAALLRQIEEEDRGQPPQQRRLHRWLASPPERLDPTARRLVEAHRKLIEDDAHGIRGDLLPDGTIDLEDGKHRAYYLRESGQPVPVWVRARDQRQLDALATLSRVQLAQGRTRPEAAEQVGRLGRTALQGPPERSPEIHLHAERAERSRERGTFRDERDF